MENVGKLVSLKEYLESVKGREVKIGSKMSFFFCGVVDENIEQTLQQLEVEELDRLHKRQAFYKQRVETFESYWFNKTENAVHRFENRTRRMKNKKEKQYLLQQMLEKLAKDKIKELAQTKTRLYNITENLRVFTPYITRNVIEVYNSIVNEDVLIIKVTGLENGRYWDKEEYDKEHSGKIHENYVDDFLNEEELEEFEEE